MPYDPIVVVKDVLDKLNAEDWEGVAELCDEGSIYTFQRNLLWRFSDRPERDRTIEDYWRNSAGLPPEVAEFQIQQHRKHSDILVRLREEIPHAGSVEELRSLSPRKLFAVWLQGQSPRTQVDRLVEVGGVSRARADKVLPSIIASWDYTLVGAVMDGDRVAHVIYRSELAPDAWSKYESELQRLRVPDVEVETERDTFGRAKPGVITSRRGSDGAWRVLADSDLFRSRPFLLGIADEESGSAV